MSPQQEDALALLASGAVDDATAILYLGAARKRTLDALVRLGHARWCPYGGDQRHGTWQITKQGRVAHAARCVPQAYKLRYKGFRT